jgi:arylsulfatase A-like enzyme
MRITSSCVIGLCAVLAAPAARASVTDQPNILVIVLDDVGPDKIPSYGGDFAGYAPLYRPNTQTVDSLATAGLRFTRAWATPMCSSTRASLQTGQQPFRTGIGTALGNDAVGLDPTRFLNLADSFASRGYATGLFGKYHIGTENAAGAVGFPPPMFVVQPHPALMGWQRFFGSYDGYLGTDPLDPDDGYFKWNRVSWLNNGTGSAATENNGVHATDRTARVALDWITSRTQPWLAMVTFNAGHSGTTASTTWTAADVNKDPAAHRTAALSCLANSPVTCADEKHQSYQALVEHADIAIRTLLDGIAPAALDNTMIFVFGDNGTPIAVEESLFNVPNRGKGSTYENGVRVPLIVAEGNAWRTGVAGTRIPVINRTVVAKINTLDIFNTLHNVAFALSVAFIDSMPFTQCFTVNDIYCGFPGKRYGYTETYPLSGVADATTKIAVSYGEDTLVSCYKPAPNNCMKEAFYDTSTDPLETAPQAWVGLRANRLRDHFTTLHTGLVSWANPTGAAVIPFCGAAVAACP